MIPRSVTARFTNSFRSVSVSCFAASVASSRSCNPSSTSGGSLVPSFVDSFSQPIAADTSGMRSSAPRGDAARAAGQFPASWRQAMPSPEAEWREPGAIETLGAEARSLASLDSLRSSRCPLSVVRCPLSVVRCPLSEVRGSRFEVRSSRLGLREMRHRGCRRVSATSLLARCAERRFRSHQTWQRARRTAQGCVTEITFASPWARWRNSPPVSN